MNILEDLTRWQIIDFVVNVLGGECIQEEGYNGNIIFSAICHNSESPKLYYNTQTYIFHCFSHCGTIGSLADLVMKCKDCDFKEAIGIIKSYFGISGKYHRHGVGRKSRNRFKKKEINYDELIIPPLDDVEYKPYMYRKFPCHRLPMWEKEGILFKSIKKFDIRYDEIGEKIIIPHFAWNENKISGVRVRNLNKNVVDKFGKYTPFYYGGHMYNHHLKYNLYGYNQNKDDISEKRIAIIFEGEKGVLQLDSMFEYNPSVAVCGSNISYEQIKMLLLLDIEEIIFAFDKQYENKEEELLWKIKIIKLANKIPNNIKISIIWDDLNEGLLDYKDSPTDKGKKIFSSLFKNRINFNDFEVIE